MSFKKTIIFIILCLMLFVVADNGAERVLAGFKPVLRMEERDGEKVLFWTRAYWPVYYQVEVYDHAPDDYSAQAGPVACYTTWRSSWRIRQDFPTETYWRVTAVSLGNRPQGGYSDWVRVPASGSLQGAILKPTATIRYPAVNMAGRYALLTWTVVEGAVNYELEFTQEPPENPNGTELSRYRLWSTREVFKNGYIADLSWVNGKSVFWRVRAIDYYGNPLGVFSDARLMYVDTSVVRPLKPVLTVDFNSDNRPTPLYPVYAWIPIPGTVSYEVEVCSQPPENPNGTSPSRYRIWHKKGPGYDIYDDMPRNQPGTYYWRVRGIDENDNTVGVYSDTGKFTVDLSRGNFAACFGDSITHGGGSLSYSPSDLEYDFETYLNFPTVNLGRSGDTTDTMVERFASDVLPFKPQYLLILGGSNSIRGGTPGKQVIHDLIEIRNMCEEHNIRPIFITLPPINPEAIARAFGEETAPHWQREMTVVNQFVRQQKYYIDIEPYLSNQSGLLPARYATDGLHPDVEGKKIIGRVINENWPLVTR